MRRRNDARFAAVALAFACLFPLPGCAAGSADPASKAAPTQEATPPASPQKHAETGHDAAPPGGAHHPDDATTHHRFQDADEWAKLFDDPSRDAWQKPDEVIAALGLKPGMMVADLGAGTGYFTVRLARAVGDRGVVLAVDPEPDMARHLGERAHQEGLRNVLPVLALFEDPFLPRGRVDRVLIVDTYHHIDDRRAYFARMREALAPGGQVAIVDFHKKPLPVGPPPEHKLERSQVVDEMQKAGWRLAREVTTLPYQYLLIFEIGATS